MLLTSMQRSLTSTRRMMSTESCQPFSKAVFSAMRKLYPEQLADKGFDNTGLLLEAPQSGEGKPSPTVLLTIDLTKAVADEAIDKSHSVVVSYHPPIFRPLKALTLANSQQASLLRLAQAGISVYSPHTAVDAAPGGLNDWLADVVTGKDINSESLHQRQVITAVKNPPTGFETAGYGRVVRFNKSQKLVNLLQRIMEGLGKLPAISVALPQSVPHELGRLTHEVSSIGICAGSGGSILGGLDVDMLFTGELSHHEALAAIEQGKCVVTAFHSNSERAFLRTRMRGLLQSELATQLKEVHLGHLVKDSMVHVSLNDSDPYEVVTSDEVETIANWNGLDISNGV